MYVTFSELSLLQPIGGLLPEDEFHVWTLFVRITELVFGPGRDGWTSNMITLLERLVQRHNILFEEVAGLEKCVITLHNLLHIPEDIYRFSAPDNYWCYAFERAVSKYISRSSNNKNIECTFALAECRREFLKFSHSLPVQSGLQIPEGGLVMLFYCMPLKSVSKIYIYMYLCFIFFPQMYESSINSARQLFEAFPRIASMGVLVGKRHYSTFLPEERQQLAVETSGNILLEATTVVSKFRSLLMPTQGYDGTTYRTSEYVLSAIDTNRNQELPLVGRIISIFATLDSSSSAYKTFVKVEVYPYKLTHEGTPEYHPHSGNPLVLPSAEHMIFPATKLLRKVILYSDPDDTSVTMLVDHLRPQLPVSADNIIVPFHPEDGDMVLISGDTNQTWLGKIQKVDRRSKTCQVFFYVESRPGVYRRENPGVRSAQTVHWASMIRSAQGRWQGAEWHPM